MCGCSSARLATSSSDGLARILTLLFNDWLKSGYLPPRLTPDQGVPGTYFPRLTLPTFFHASSRLCWANGDSQTSWRGAGGAAGGWIDEFLRGRQFLSADRTLDHTDRTIDHTDSDTDSTLVD